MAHTPGPWAASLSEHVLDGNRIVSTRVNGPRRGIVATAYAHERNVDECDANARLIAAAPELLRCLESATELLKSEPLLVNTVRSFRRAIALAKGEAS